MDPLPVACSLGARDLARRQAELRAGVLGQAFAVEPLGDGMRWRFGASDGLLARLGPLLDAERHCCRFLRIVLAAEPDQGTIVLEITGPEGTPEFLATWVQSP